MRVISLVLLANLALGNVVVEEEETRFEHVPDHVDPDNHELFDPDDLIPVGKDFDRDALLDEIDLNLIDPRLLTQVKRKLKDSELLNEERLIPSNTTRASTQCSCGYSKANQPAGRIVGGQAVTNNARPYQAYLQLCFSDGCYLCGGTLINKRYVITAMHCILDGRDLPENTVVGLGLISRSDNGPNVQKLGVEKYYQREDYRRLNNDIAILRLDSDVEFNEDVQPACLPTDPSLTYANQEAIVSGWGTTTYGGSTSRILMEVELTITEQSDSTCTAYGNLPMSQMCAYTPEKDSCQGDSGGPMVVLEDGRNTLVGVVSYGRGCASEGYAGVYARVTNFLDWINSIVADGNCGADQSTVPPGSTTTTTKRPRRKKCKMGCLEGIPPEKRGWFDYTIEDQVYRIKCNKKGKCRAKDGTDLCALLNNPCKKNG